MESRAQGWTFSVIVARERNLRIIKSINPHVQPHAHPFNGRKPCPITSTPAPIAAPTRATSVGRPRILMSMNAATVAKNSASNALAAMAHATVQIVRAPHETPTAEFQNPKMKVN